MDKPLKVNDRVFAARTFSRLHVADGVVEEMQLYYAAVVVAVDKSTQHFTYDLITVRFDDGETIQHPTHKLLPENFKPLGQYE